MKARFLVVVCVLLSASCHGRFKRFAADADIVHLEAVVSSTAVVHLSEGAYNQTGTVAEALVDAAVTASAQVASGEVRGRLEAVLRPEDIGKLVQSDATELIGNGPPFAASGDPPDGTIQIDVVSYGIRQSGGGPAFFANYRVRGYRSDNGKKMYKASAACQDNAFYTVSTPANIVGTAVTIGHLQSMSDEELRQAVENVVKRCTSRVVAKIRKHAG